MKGKYTVLILLLLTGILTLGAYGSFAAEQPGLTKQQALETAKNMLQLPDNLENLEVGYEEKDDNGQKGKFWSFNWNSDGTDGYSINVRINALTGEIVDYSRYDNNSWEKRSLLPKISRDQGEKIARSFMQKLQPAKAGQVILNQSYGESDYTGGPVNYQFQYQRAANGIPVLMNSISLTVDGDTGRVFDYHCIWDDTLKLPAAEKVITAAQAEEIFRSKISLEEKYFLPADSKDKKKTPSIVYAVKKPYLWINALTGEPVATMPGDYGAGGAMENSSRKMKDMGSASTETDIRINQGEISKEEALAIIKQKVTIPNGYTMNSANYRRDWSTEDGRVWAFTFLLEPGKWDNALDVAVDSKSGEIVEYAFNKTMAPDAKPKYDLEKCRKTAEEILTRLAGSKKDALQYREDSNPVILAQKVETLPYQYHFVWVRQENGLPYDNDRIDMDVNTITGEVQWYRMSWSGVTLTAPAVGMLSLEDAYQSFFKEKPLQLAYTTTDNGKNSGQGEVVLVYRPADTGGYNLISAADGRLINSQGKTRDESRIEVFTDIQGHWAAGDIQALALKKVVSGDNGRFYPDREVTGAEFIKMLVILKDIYVDTGLKVKLPPEIKEGTWYYPYAAAAYRDGIIKAEDGFQPNGSLRREYAAVLIARSMGYDKVAGIKGIYQIPLKDFAKVGQNHQGHVAIVYGLGIIRGENGLYSPEKSLTKAESASILVRMAGTK